MERWLSTVHQGSNQTRNRKAPGIIGFVFRDDTFSLLRWGLRVEVNEEETKV